MRDLIDILEGAEDKQNFDIMRTATKVVLWLRGTDSARYTKLGRNLMKLAQLEEQIKKLKDALKLETKVLVADLFEADDACRTRVVETVGFAFKLSKNSDPTTTYKYAKILEELEDHLTPELIKVLETLKEKHKTVSERTSAMKTYDKNDPDFRQSDLYPVDESLSDVFQGLKSMLSKFKNFILNKLTAYDQKLAELEAYLDS